MRSIEELEIRLAVCRGSIKLLQSECAGDPRQPEAIRHYEEQFRKLNAELVEATRLKENPPPIVIGLKAATLSGKAGM